MRRIIFCMGRLTSNDGVQEFGMKITGYEICTCSDVMERKGEKGAPNTFVARVRLR